jgi:hypothetical protein
LSPSKNTLKRAISPFTKIVVMKSFTRTRFAAVLLTVGTGRS